MPGLRTNKTAAVIYWSRPGNTEAMAKAIAAGLQAGGIGAALLRVGAPEAFDALQCDGLAFGCPAMGKEVLEEKEFEPFFAAAERNLAGKKVALFGTYGWSDGKWMRDWRERASSNGVELFGQGLIFQVENPLITKIKRLFGRDKKPDEAACLAFGKEFADALSDDKERIDYGKNHA